MEALTKTFWTTLYLQMLFIATEYDTKRLSVMFLPTSVREFVRYLFWNTLK